MDSLKLALFDMDGTLIDSQGQINMAMNAAFDSAGLKKPSRASVRSVIGLSLPNAIEELLPEGSDADLSAMVEVYKDAYASLHGAEAEAAAPLYPGVIACLEALAAQENVLLGVATGKSRRGVNRVFDTYDIERFFQTVQVSDNHPSKPHPAMVQSALSETGVEPQDAVMIGDTSFDMDMGRAAGVHILAVDWGYHSAEQLTKSKPDAMAHDYCDVPDLLNGLWGQTNE
ncbi:MAG: HAD-IA family hydrolase [Mangrovicoccus sp.]